MASQGGPTGNEKAARRDGLERPEAGGAGPGSQARESGPIPDGAFWKPVSGRPSKAGCPPFCGMLGRGG